MTFTEQSIVGEVVAEFPKAGDFFKGRRIDFCCGGNKPISEASAERGLEPSKVVEELNELYVKTTEERNAVIDWRKASYTELISHIVNKHHNYLKEELPQLAPYVTKVFRVHGEHHPHLQEVHTLFGQLRRELEEHTVKEEVAVFPVIIDFENEPAEVSLETLTSALQELAGEHDEAGAIMKRLREITHDFTPPVGACGTYRLVYQRLADLESDLFEHIHLENNILFKKVVANI